MPFALESSIACLHPSARLACAVLVIVGAMHVLFIGLRRRRFDWQIALAWTVVLVLTIWFGSLRYSPLQFGGPRRPVLQAFEIRRPNRPAAVIRPGEIVSAKPGSPLVIHPQTLPAPMACLWSPSAGGALDDPHSCDTTYVAPGGVTFEILRLRVQPACGLPPAVAQIKISILP